MINEYSTDVERMIFNSFKELKFEKERHLYSIYTDGKLRYLPSVSSLVEKFAPKFNKQKMLPLSATKASRIEGRPVSSKELEARWIKKNKDACDLGHDTHDFLEKYTGIQTPSTPQEKAGIKYLKSLQGKYKISFRELKAFSREFMYAGTMDLPLEVIEGSSFEIADYKTNGDLFKAYDYLYPPFETLESSPYNKYQIQLSYYQIMLEEINLKITNRRLVHLKEDESFKVFNLLDLTEYLKDYHKTINKTSTIVWS